MAAKNMNTIKDSVMNDLSAVDVAVSPENKFREYLMTQGDRLDALYESESNAGEQKESAVA